MTGKRGRIHDLLNKEVESFIVGANSIIENYFLYIGFPDASFNIVKVVGKRYIRLDAIKGEDTWTWGFIDMVNGDCLKAASFRSPSEKTPRGNVRDRHNGLSFVTWSGFAPITCGEGWPMGLRLERRLHV